MNKFENLCLIKASFEDARDIFLWRNDELSRYNSCNSEVLVYEDHLKWFSNKIQDTNCLIYILRESSSGSKLGMIRVEKKGYLGKISYLISPNYRNHGYGSKIINILESVIPNELSVLIGFVKSGNTFSQKCFLKNHYIELECSDEMICYVKNISKT